MKEWISRRNRKKGARFLAVLAAAAGISPVIFAIPVQAGGGTSGDSFVRQYAFLASDSSERHDEEFEQELTVNGTRYVLQGIEYSVQEKTPKKIQQEAEKVIESGYAAEGMQYVPEPEITENGVTYRFDHMEAAEESTQEAYGYTDYSYAVSEASVPHTKEVAAVNPVTGETETVACTLTGVRRLDSRWEDAYIDITFLSYDAEVFEWNGLQVRKNEESPLAGYEGQLLASVGEDASGCRVRDISWNGGAYTDSGGTLCRNARAYIQRRVTPYRAEYAGTLHAGTKYRLYYKGTETVESSDAYDYQMLATATYQAERGILPYVVAGTGIFLVACLAVAILLLASGIFRDCRRGQEQGQHPVGNSRRIPGGR